MNKYNSEGEICFETPFTKKILKKKKLIKKCGKEFLHRDFTLRGVDIDRICVFRTGENLAILCFQKETDEKGFYRGSIRFNKCEIDTPKKAIAKFLEYKDMLNQMEEGNIAVRKRLWFDTYSVTLLTSIQMTIDNETESDNCA